MITAPPLRISEETAKALVEAGAALSVSEDELLRRLVGNSPPH